MRNQHHAEDVSEELQGHGDEENLARDMLAAQPSSAGGVKGGQGTRTIHSHINTWRHSSISDRSCSYGIKLYSGHLVAVVDMKVL